MFCFILFAMTYNIVVQYISGISNGVILEVMNPAYSTMFLTHLIIFFPFPCFKKSGALDGIRFSNSLFFEKFANWTSLNIEAGERNYKGLVTNRPNAINIQVALCNDVRSLHYVPDLKDVPEVEGIYEFMNISFIR